MKLVQNEVIPAYYADFYSNINSSKDVPDTFTYADGQVREEYEIEVIYYLH